MSEFYPSGYGYNRDDSGYVVSRGSIPSKIRHGYIDVWSAFTALPPEGERITNGSEMFFYTERDAINACHRHMEQRRTAA